MFGKEKKLSVDELIKAAQALSEEEQAKLAAVLKGETVEGNGAEEPPTDNEGSEPAGEQEPEQPAPEEPPKAEEPAKEQSMPAEEPPPLEDETEAQNETDEATRQRIDALEEQLAKIAAILENIVADGERKPFGAPGTPGAGADASDDDRVMSSYYKNPRSYK